MSERKNNHSDRAARGESERYDENASYHYAGYTDQNRGAEWHHHDQLHAQQALNDYPEYSEYSEPVNYPGREFLDSRFDPSTHYLDQEDPQFSETGEVWLKEARNRISYNDSDLVDVAQRKPAGFLAPLAGAAGVIAMLCLIGLLAFSSLPDLSPEEIIAMKGYEGEQPIKTPFNLASLRDCNGREDCAEEEAAAATPNTTETVATTTTEYVEVQEIPAATTFAVSTTDSYASYQQSLTVLQQWSNVRSEPDANAYILTSLAVGTEVTMLERNGSWYEVMVNNNDRTVGFMHSSTVAEK